MEAPDHQIDYVTVTIGEQLFGLPIARVQDVFIPGRMTRVPLAPPEIAGLLNLRGRVLTIIDMRRRLAFGPAEEGAQPMAIGIECKGESYGLLIDSVGAVLSLAADTRESNPMNLEARLSRVAVGVHRVENRLMVVLDVDRILDVGAHADAA